MKPTVFAWEAIRSACSDLARRPFSSTMSVLAMALALFLLTAFLIGSRGVGAMIDRLAADAVIEVYLRPTVDETSRRRLLESLRQMSAVGRAELIASDRALAEFRELYPDLGDVSALLGGNPFPASLRIWPAAGDPQSVARLTEQLSHDAAVESVRFDREWVESLARVSRAAGSALLLGGATLLLGAWTIIGAVVRLALDDKRDEVVLMRLVGASIPFVLAPLLLGGALLGTTGGIVAVGLIVTTGHLIAEWARNASLAGGVAFMAGGGLTLLQAIVVILLGTISGLGAAAISAGRSAFR